MENLVNDDVEVVAPGSSLLKQLRKKGMMKKKQQSGGGLFGDLLHTHNKGNKGKITPLNEGDDTSTDQLQALRNAQSQLSQEAKAPVDFDWNDKHDGSTYFFIVVHCVTTMCAPSKSTHPKVPIQSTHPKVPIQSTI